MADEQEFTPRTVTELADNLARDTGHRPTVERIQDRRWRLTMAGERVYMTVDYKLSGGGRCVWAASTLLVDGERVELSSGYGHFVRIWKDPDKELDRRVPEPAPITVPLAARPPEDAPRLVQTLHRELVGKLAASPETQVCVGQADDDQFWAVEVTAEQAVLRLNYRLYRNGHCDRAKVHPLQLMVDGEDRTAEVEGRVDRALALMFRPASPAPETAPPVGGAARSNSLRCAARSSCATSSPSPTPAASPLRSDAKEH